VVPVAILVVFVAGLGFGSICFAVGARRYESVVGIRATPVLLLFVAGLLLLLLSGGASWVALDQVGPLEVVRFIGNPQSLRDVSLYVGVLGLALTALGFLLAVGAARDTADRAVLALFLVGAAPMLFVNWLAADHFWAGRRYVPLLIP